MITILNHRDFTIAQQIYVVQQAAYTVERDLINYPDFPPLRVTVADIQAETEHFLGYWLDTALVGELSFASTPGVLDIGSLVVHPQAFRRGIASALLRAVEHYGEPGGKLTVSTAAKNRPAVQLYQKQGYHLTEQTTLPDGLELVRFTKFRSYAVEANFQVRA